MDPNIVFAKTPIGDEAVRQSTRVVQRNLRLVLVQVDGKLTVEELGIKIGDPRLVDNALRELEEGGFIAPTMEAVTAWKESKLNLKRREPAPAAVPAGGTAWEGSAFATGESGLSSFSAFGKPPGSGQARRPAVTAEPVVPRPQSKVEPPVTEYRRKGPSGALLALVAAVVLAIAVAALLVFPYERFKPEIEAELGRLWQTRVQVGAVHLRLLPAPALRLIDVRVGDAGGSSIDELRIPSPLSLLGAGPRRLARVEVIGGRVAADQLLAMPMWGGAAGRAAPQTQVQTIGVDRLKVFAGSMQVGELAGDIGFRPDGQLEKAALQTVDRSLRVMALPTAAGIQLVFEGLGWRPTDESPLTFDALQAKGLLQRGRLVVDSFDVGAMGGTVRGNLLVDWSRGLAMSGDATLERLDMRRVASVFASSLSMEGDLSGALRLRSSGRDWQPMWNSAELFLDATVMRGVLYGVDLGEAARRGYGSTVRAGSTRFERLTARVSVEPGRIVGRDVVLNAGMFTANGHFVGNRERQVEGSLLVTMQTSVSSLTLPVKVTGTLPNLQATVIR